MAKFIMVGCDLHDKSMLLKIAEDHGKPIVRTWCTDGVARQAMILDLKRRAKSCGATRIIFAYEACGFGFRLHDELKAAGIETYVLAPSKMARSPKHRRAKTDEKDAQHILDIIRSFIFGGVEMPSVWVPDLATRDDRELVRRRLAIAEDKSAAQVRIRWLLKGHGIDEPSAKAWTEAYWRWLEQLAGGQLPPGAAAALASLMRQVQWLKEEILRLDAQVKALSQTPRYAAKVGAVCRHKGVGLLTAMVFLSEMGDLSRFANRQKVGAFLGLVPDSYESGENKDHKGHITRQGPSRVRKVLCQAVWSRLRTDQCERLAYDRIVARNPKHKKIAVVARMRMMAITMWHHGLAAQEATRAQAQPVNPTQAARSSPTAGTRWDPTAAIAPPDGTCREQQRRGKTRLPPCPSTPR